MWLWFSVLAVYLKAIFIFLVFFFHCVHLLWLPTAAVKTLRYSQATVKSRINTAKPLLSSNYRHRTKPHSRNLFLFIINLQICASEPSNLIEGFISLPLDQSNPVIQRRYDVPEDQRYNFSDGVHTNCGCILQTSLTVLLAKLVLALRSVFM